MLELSVNTYARPGLSLVDMANTGWEWGQCLFLWKQEKGGGKGQVVRRRLPAIVPVAAPHLATLRKLCGKTSGI